MAQPVPMPSVGKSPYFFERDRDGSVRLRLRLSPEEASLIEEAAGTVPLMSWIYRTLSTEASARVEENRAALADISPPEVKP